MPLNLKTSLIDYNFCLEVYRTNPDSYATLKATVANDDRIFLVFCKVMDFAFGKFQDNKDFWDTKINVAKMTFCKDWTARMDGADKTYGSVAFASGKNWVMNTALENMSLVCKSCFGVGHKVGKACPLHKAMAQDTKNKATYKSIWAEYKVGHQTLTTSQKAIGTLIGKRVQKQAAKAELKKAKAIGSKDVAIEGQIDIDIADQKTEITELQILK